MSFKILDAVLSRSRSKYGDRLVLVSLADRANEQGLCWPSTKDTATRANMDIRSVQRSFRRLVNLGELAIEPQAGPYGCNVFRITPPDIHAGGDDVDAGGKNRGVTPMSQGGDVDATRTPMNQGMNHKEPGECAPPDNFNKSLPATFPRNADDAATHADLKDVPREFALKIWAEAYQNGGKDDRYQPINSFGDHVLKLWKAERSPKAKPPQKRTERLGTAERISLEAEMKEAKTEVKRIQDSYEAHIDMTAKDRTEIKRLKTIIKDCKTKLGNRV